jgi:tetratricopeptide (TPR) repeat protein
MAESVHDLYNQGEKLKDEGKYPEAIEKFEQAVAMDETFALAHFAWASPTGSSANTKKQSLTRNGHANWNQVIRFRTRRSA